MVCRALIAFGLGLGTAAAEIAPTPPNQFPAGVAGNGRGIDHALSDAQAAGFNAIRLFVRWDRIETTPGEPAWDCRYTTKNDFVATGDGRLPRLWPDVPCEPGPCGCGFSLDERVAAVAGAGLPLVLTVHGTPEWARGAASAQCPADTPGHALPLRADRAKAFAEFVGALAARYGGVAFAFELWNEPDLERCREWAGTPEQYKRQILSAAWAVKASGAAPGLVIAPTLVHPSGQAMDAWMDWSAPIDRLSFNLYETSLPRSLATLDRMDGWCRGHRRCPGFWIAEFSSQRSGARACPGPRTNAPGSGNLAVMRRCQRRSSCRGFFLYSLTDRNDLPQCDEGLLDARGCRKRRLCQIARRYFGRTQLPFVCAGCGV